MNEFIQNIATRVGIHYYRKSKLQQDSENLAKEVARECIRIIEFGMDYSDHSDPKLSMAELKAQKWCRDAIKEKFDLK